MCKFCYIPRPIINIPDNGMRALSQKGSYWKNGEKLQIYLYPSSVPHRMDIAAVYSRWLKDTSLSFEFVSNPNISDIRIEYKAGGSWSYVGTDALVISKSKPTMQIGWAGRSVLYHEVGHSLGLLHEHQNPDGGIEWNENAVYDALSKPPNSWNRQQIEHNVLNAVNPATVDFTRFDTDSVMMYFFPDEWVANGPGTHENDTPSVKDLEHIAGLYPKPVDNEVKEFVQDFPKIRILHASHLRYTASWLGLSTAGTKRDLIKRLRAYLDR